tara:strand:+ start:516 stop:938 length:423 start_codon:yes stop_codon:yes gene_type:complete
MVKHTVTTQISTVSESRPIAMASRLAYQRAKLQRAHRRASFQLVQQYRHEKAQLQAFQYTYGVEEISEFIDAWDAIPQEKRQNATDFVKERDIELEKFLEYQNDAEHEEHRDLLVTHLRRSDYVHWCVERDTRESLGMNL